MAEDWRGWSLPPGRTIVSPEGEGEREGERGGPSKSRDGVTDLVRRRAREPGPVSGICVG